MASGFLTPNGVPMVAITVAGHPLDAAIDTGFESGFQLPDSWLPFLNPPSKQAVRFILPNGLVEDTTTYTVRVELDSSGIDVETYFSPNDDVIVGLELLRGFRLEINFVAGSVVLERVTSP